MHFPKKLQQKIENRKKENALRQLNFPSHLIDFTSNDYLGFSKNEAIFDNVHKYLVNLHLKQNGTTGSRLISGNHSIFQVVETFLANFHNNESALIFNSGYNANVGFFSSVPQRGDIILYDEYSHASIRDGINISNAKAYKFKHNDLENLKEILKRVQHDNENIYVITESVFSMDGDSPDLVQLTELCEKYNALLIIDEAHAVGVFGEKGEGLIQYLKLESNVFARIVTFGKAMGCHGAAILGSEQLRQYLVNFCRSFIYTTSLPPHALATIKASYSELSETNNRKKLHQNILHFKNELQKNKVQDIFISSNSSIQCCVISGNESVKNIALKLEKNGFDVKPILYPTVPKGQERLRFCLHSYNSEKEISEVLSLLATFTS